MKYLVLSLVIYCGVTSVGCGELVTDFELDEGYRGWVSIDYGRNDCTSTTEHGSYSIIRVDSEGRACSRLSESPSGRIEHVYYVDDLGRRVQRLKPGHWGQDEDMISMWSVTMSCFFIGTEKEFREPWPAGPGCP